MSEERLYVEVKTTHNTYIGTFFRGKISEAIDFYVKKESFPPKQRHITNMKIPSDKARTIFVA